MQLLAVELLNVLHRLLLTRDPPAVQLQVTAVVQETIRAAQDHLQQQRSNRGQDCCAGAKHERCLTTNVCGVQFGSLGFFFFFFFGQGKKMKVRKSL